MTSFSDVQPEEFYFLDVASNNLQMVGASRPWIKPQQRRFRDEDIPIGDDKRALYESMLREMRDAAGDSGEFYTPRHVVQLMVEMLEPFNGRVYDPAMGSGGMFVQADNFVRAHGGTR